MNSVVKVALILCATALAGLAAYIYFSPYETCVRAQTRIYTGMYQDPLSAARVQCAERLGGTS